jgi:hypothetical protein
MRHLSKVFWLVLVGLFALTLIGCYRPTEPDELYERLNPPAWYHTAWIETMECAGSRLKIPPVRFHQVDFYRVNVDTLTVNGTRAVAFATGWDIYLTSGVADSARIVKHEMMHVITQIFAHPVDPFYRCKLMRGQ